MPAKKTDGLLTVKVGGMISDGKGGSYAKGAKISAVDAEAAASLKAKGLVE